MLVLGVVDDMTLLSAALWATRETEEIKDNKELTIRTTLRELLIYIVFLTVLCIGMSLGLCLRFTLLYYLFQCLKTSAHVLATVPIVLVKL